jgi:hypothetical protein
MESIKIIIIIIIIVAAAAVVVVVVVYCTLLFLGLPTDQLPVCTVVSFLM